MSVAYNPSVVEVISCSALSGATCDPKPATPNTVQISGAAFSGLTGTQTLGTLTLKGIATGTLPSDANLTVTVTSLLNPSAQTIAHTISNGVVRVLPPLPDANQDTFANATDALCLLRQIGGFAGHRGLPQPAPLRRY